MSTSPAEIVVSLLLVGGSLFVLIGSIGIIRLPDFFMRLHAPTVATTFGVGGILFAVIGYSGSVQLGLRDLLITMFLFFTAPVSTYLLAQGGLRRRLESRAPLPDVASAPTAPPEHEMP
ncbi:MAG: monovalent cation/H(+) antiporter subunit G [Casimicrobiaceae bacterium]